MHVRESGGGAHLSGSPFEVDVGLGASARHCIASGAGLANPRVSSGNAVQVLVKSSGGELVRP